MALPDEAAATCPFVDIPFSSESFGDLHAANVLTYIGGYTAKRLRDELCSDCRKVVEGKILKRGDEQTLLRLKQFENMKPGSGLTAPSTGLLKQLKFYECKFRRVVTKALLASGKTTGVKATLFRALSTVQTIHSVRRCQKPSGCRVVDKVLGLFINIRLHFCLKTNRHSLKTVGLNRNRKILKLQHK